LKPSPKKKIIIGLAILIMVSGAAVVTIFIDHYRQKAKEPRYIFEALPEGANVSIGKFRQTSSRDGKDEWELHATAAHYMDKDKKAILEDISMTFFLENDQQVLLTAERGMFKTDTQNVQVSGGVVLTSNDVTLRTDRLEYRHDRRWLWTDAPVTIQGESFQLQAQRMHLDMNTSQTVFEGNVQGSFNEDLTM
jgi:LPS export ABC transporter protein LptC